MECSLHETIILKVCMFLQQFFSLMRKFLVETNRGFKIRLRRAFRHYNLLAISNAKWFFLGTETDNVFLKVEERAKKKQTQILVEKICQTKTVRQVLRRANLYSQTTCLACRRALVMYKFQSEI